MVLRDKAKTMIVNDVRRYLDEVSRLLVRGRKFVPAVSQKTMTVKEYESIVDILSAAFAYIAVVKGMMKRMERLEFDKDVLEALYQRGYPMDSELGEIDLQTENLAFDLGWVGMIEGPQA